MSTTCALSSKSSAFSSGRGPFSPPNLTSSIDSNAESITGSQSLIGSDLTSPKFSFCMCCTSQRPATDNDEKKRGATGDPADSARGKKDVFVMTHDWRDALAHSCGEWANIQQV